MVPASLQSADLRGTRICPGRTDLRRFARAFFLLAFCYTLYRLLRTPRWQLMMLNGVLLGLLSLTRPNGFALLALLLASVGLFGVMSYNVARRTREIGIRMALGARRSMVLRRILQETVTVSVAGILIGLAGALATTRLVAAFLFELSPRDPSTLLATAVVLMATTMAAGWLPARRAAAVDPMRALRNE